MGLQGQYDISVSLSGTRSYIYLAMRLDHGDFRSTPVNGHFQDRRACLKGARTGSRPRSVLNFFRSSADDPQDIEWNPMTFPSRSETSAILP